MRRGKAGEVCCRSYPSRRAAALQRLSASAEHVKHHRDTHGSGRGRSGRASLGRVLDAAGAARALGGGVDRDEGAIDDGALEVEVPLDRVQVAAVAVERGSDARGGLERRGERRERVGLAGRGRDASGGEPVVRRERLEELDDRLEERDSLSALGAAGGKAGGLEGAVARAVRAPLVLPELLVLAVDVDPELQRSVRTLTCRPEASTYLLHERQGVTGTLGGQKLLIVNMVSPAHS